MISQEITSGSGTIYFEGETFTAKFKLENGRIEQEYAPYAGSLLFDSRTCALELSGRIVGEIEIYKNNFHKFFQTPQIAKVIFNEPATIVFWKDGTKTVVKAQDGEPFDKEKGLAMAFVKKIHGNKGNYNNIFREYGGE